MADECRNIPPSSPDRQINLVRSYCDMYDDFAREAEGLKGKAKMEKLNEMAAVLNTIREIQGNKNTPPAYLQGGMNQRIEIGRSVDTSPSVIQMQFGINSFYDSSFSDKNAKMQDYEKHGVSFRFFDSKFSSEQFDKLSSVSEVTNDGSYYDRPFNGILSNGETKRIRLKFGRMSEEFEVSYAQGVLHFKGTRAYPLIEGSILVNMGDLRRNGGMQKIVVGPGADSRGDGNRMVIFFRLSGQ